MHTEVTHTSGGQGALIRIVENDDDIAARRRRRRQLIEEMRRARHGVAPNSSIWVVPSSAANEAVGDREVGPS